MATRILLDPRQDLPDASLGPAPVLVEATPTGIREDGSIVVLPTTISFVVNTAADIIELTAPTVSWAWVIEIRRIAGQARIVGQGIQAGSVLARRTVTWTDAVQIAWADLTDLDPATLQPTPDAVASWTATQALAQQVKASFDALVAGAPSALDTFLEVANQLTSDESGAAALAALVATKAPLASPTFTGTVAGVSKAMVGLGSVDNTADTAKPVSTAQAAALALKADQASVAATYVPLTGATVSAYAYGVRADMVTVTDAAITAGSPLLSSASAAFTTADQGKIVYVTGAGASGAPLIVYITSVAGGVATLGGNASTTVSGATTYYGTDNRDPLIAANNAAAGALGLGGTIKLPRGNMMTTAALAQSDNVSMIGEGKNTSVIFPVGTVHAFYRLGTLNGNTPVKNMSWTDMGVDGTLQTGLQKGWYFNVMQGCTFLRTLCQNTGASGYGCDYLADTWFIAAVAYNCGRLGTTSSPGCSGFGIGTGLLAVENVYLVDCIARNNKRFGAFFENQNTATQSAGVQIIGGRYEGNQWGISDNGTSGLIAQGAHIVNNIADGFKVTTTAAIHQTGVDGLVTDCVIVGNGGDGVQLDYTQTGSATYGRYRIHGNTIRKNTGYGVRVRLDSTDAVSRLAITDNEVVDNALTGILIAGASVSASLLTHSVISRNRALNNGTAGTSAQTYGIHVSCSLSSVDIIGNVSGDTAAAGSKTQTHGLYLATGVSLTGGGIYDNDLRNNATASLANLGNATTVSPFLLERNRGFNPQGINPGTFTGSPMTYTAGSSPETHYLIGLPGGTTVTKNTVTIWNSATTSPQTLTINLEPYDVLVITYPSAITAWKIDKK